MYSQRPGLRVVPACHEDILANVEGVHQTPHGSLDSSPQGRLVEVWFGIIERQAIHRRTFTSVSELVSKIRGFINGWNERSHTFVRTKPPSKS